MSCDAAAGGGASFSSLCQDHSRWLMATVLLACRSGAMSWRRFSLTRELFAIFQIVENSSMC